MYFLKTHHLENKESGRFAEFCPNCEKTRAMRSLSAIEVSKAYTFPYRKRRRGAIAVCDFCDIRLTDTTCRTVCGSWRTKDGLDALVERTALKQDYAPLVDLIPRTAEYDHQDLSSILDSIDIRARDRQKDKGGLGALIGFYVFGFLAWQLAVFSALTSPYVMIVTFLAALLGLAAGVAAWRWLLFRRNTKKFVKAALKKHRLSPESLMEVAKEDSRAYRASARVLRKIIADKG